MSRLGRDELEEILSRLPAKAVIKACSLSKSLPSILSSDFFIRRQTINSSRLDCGLFLLPMFRSDDPEFHLLPGQRDSGFGIPPDPISFLKQKGRNLLGSSQGLVLLKNEDEFVICNPATRIWVSLAIPEGLLSRIKSKTWPGFMFECHPTSQLGSYTIIVSNWIFGASYTGLTQRSCSFGVYCNGRWEESCDTRMDPNDEHIISNPVALFKDEGLVLHYLCGMLPKKAYMVAYDIKHKCVFRRFDLPNDADPTRWSIFKWKRSSSHHNDTVGLAGIDQGDNMVTVWVLEDYERESWSWRRVLRKTTLEMGMPPQEEDALINCCVVNEKFLVLTIRSRVYVYEMKGNNVGRLQAVAEHGIKSYSVELVSYSNTLLHPILGGG